MMINLGSFKDRIICLVILARGYYCKWKRSCCLTRKVNRKFSNF